MKLFLKFLLKNYLKFLVSFVLYINKPIIIAIAGSTNKTFTKQAIIKVLADKNISFRANPNSFNTEIGLPLAILNLPSGYHSYKKWFYVFIKSFSGIFIKFPKYLILEMGVSDKGDMKYLLKIINPSIAIITDISQRYLESFSGMDELSDEYYFLLNKINKNGLIILNNDNSRIKSLLNNRIKAKIITYGLDSLSDFYAYNLIKNIHGQTFDINALGKITNYHIPYFGKHHIYSFLAGLIINTYVFKTEKK
jgi:UDP-N-acetylmuramoyl-tripeptide--D-alanyl-D-alanine ligase